jgi:hypothetical protein
MPWHGKGHHDEAKKKDPEAIPILKYGPGNNFAKFKEAISKAALKEYGDIGKLIHQGTYYIPPAPDKATYGSLDPAIDIDGMNKATYLKDMTAYQKKIREMEDDCSKLFSLIMMYLSEESLRSKMRAQLGQDQRCILLNIKERTPIIYQDFTSVIDLVTK